MSENAPIDQICSLFSSCVFAEGRKRTSASLRSKNTKGIRKNRVLKICAHIPYDSAPKFFVSKGSRTIPPMVVRICEIPTVPTSFTNLPLEDIIVVSYHTMTKWCFLANDASFLMEFLGKLAHQAVQEGDECLVLVNSKIAEFEKLRFFPKEAHIVSKVDWCKKQYDPSRDLTNKLSWKYFFSTFDRYKTSFNYKKAFDIVSQLYQFTEAMLLKEKPDIIVTEIPSGIHNEIVYKFCNELNIPCIGFTDSLFDTLALYDKGLTDSRFEQTFSTLRTQDVSQKDVEFIKKWIDLYTSHRKVPGYDKVVKVHFNQLGLLVHYIKRLREVGKILLKYAFSRNKWKDYDFESEAILRHSIEAPFEMERRQFRIRNQRHFYGKIGEQDQFFLYPLQFQPEASSSVMAPYYCNQADTIKNIAFSLPFPFKLYVKEHPMAVGRKPDEFYEFLSRIPNVKLIGFRESAAELIKNCKGVITLSSTMGLEAALTGKPSYVFGDVWYSYHPFCRKIRNFEELGKKLLEDLSHPPDTSNLSDTNVRFVASYWKNTIPGDIATASFEKDTNDYTSILSALRKRI